MKRSREEIYQLLWGKDIPPQQGPTMCVYAAQYFGWAEQHVSAAERRRDLVYLNQCRLLILNRYMELRERIPNDHRYHVRPQGHVCIWHIFESCMTRLLAVETDLTPPMLFLPPPPPPPPPPQRSNGIYLGEDITEQ